MALPFDKLLAFLKEADVRYLQVPDQPVVAVGTTTESGRQFLIHTMLEAEGTLLQFRTSGYLVCPLTSQHFWQVLQLVNELNHKMRLVKFAIDPSDGEVTVFCDLAVVDSEPTTSQVVGLLMFVMERLRECADRI
jgi:hypothetical protein